VNVGDDGEAHFELLRGTSEFWHGLTREGKKAAIGGQGMIRSSGPENHGHVRLFIPTVQKVDSSHQPLPVILGSSRG